MVSGQALDKIDLLDDRGEHVAALPYNAGLASCIPASAIRKFLEAR